MLKRLFLTVGTIALLLFAFSEASPASEFGTAEEAKAMLDKAVTAVKKDRIEGSCHVQRWWERLQRP